MSSPPQLLQRLLRIFAFSATTNVRLFMEAGAPGLLPSDASTFRQAWDGEEGESEGREKLWNSGYR
jgi:hypothetical protein